MTAWVEYQQHKDRQAFETQLTGNSGLRWVSRLMSVKNDVIVNGLYMDYLLWIGYLHWSLCVVYWSEERGVNLARSIFGWGSLCDWLSPLCDLSGGLLGCFQGCVSSSVMNKGWLKRMSCITGSVTFISAVRYLSFWIRLESAVTEWISGTEARLFFFNLLWCLACCQLEAAFGDRLSSLKGCTGLLSWQNGHGKNDLHLALFI